MSSSPVVEILRNLLVVNKRGSKAVYLQLAEQITTLVQGEILQAGNPLPGTRQLAEVLRLHRKTIVAAYEELVLQGIVTMVPNRGTFVNRDIATRSVKDKKAAETPFFPVHTTLPVPHNRILEIESPTSKGNWMLEDGNPDPRLFQPEKIGVGFSTFLRKNYSGSSTFLQHVLCQYLGDVHHVSVQEDQLLFTQNSTMGIALVTQALLRKGDIVVVGDPGNYKVNMAVQQAGALLKTIPVDGDGMDIGMLEELCKKQTIKMLYISPQNHYPTTTILSYARRLELLRLACHYGFFILEEETENVFDYQRRRLPSLASLDTEGVVVYVNSFEKVLRPDWNIGYVVAARNVLQEIRKYIAYWGMCHVSFAQGIFGSALQSGSLQRLIRRNTKVYQDRRNFFCQLLRVYWSGYVHFEVPKSGLGLWLHFDWDFNLASFAKRCAKADIAIPGHLLYQSRKWTAMRLGFGQWNEEEAETFILAGRRCF